MDNVNNNVDAASALPKALEQMQEELKPLIVKFDGSYDSSRRQLNVKARCMQNEQAHHALHRIFFDLFYYLPVDTRGMTYVLDFETYKDPSFSQQVHYFNISTRVDAMPDTGQVTREEWANFTSQLIYTKDGVPQQLQDPEPFYDEQEQENLKDVPLPVDPEPEQKEE